MTRFRQTSLPCTEGFHGDVAHEVYVHFARVSRDATVCRRCIALQGVYGLTAMCVAASFP